MLTTMRLKLANMPTKQHLFWTGQKQALPSDLNMLDEFNKVSGLKLNEKKTEALWFVPILAMTNFFCQERN